MNRLRAGILGIGNIAGRHGQALLALRSQVELAACCSRNQDHARAFAEKYSGGRAAVFADHHEMLERASLDLLIICLPPFAHTDEVELAAARGIHLLIEKPIALESERAWQMVQAAERAGIKTQIGLMYRFGAAVEAFKAHLAAGEVGRVGLMSAFQLSNSLNAPWWRALGKSGGQLVEQNIHLFDLQRYFIGEPLRVYSRRANLFHRAMPDYEVEDVSATVVEYADGALGVIYATNAAVPNQWRKGWQVITQNRFAEFSDWNHATFTPTDVPGRAPETIASDRDPFVAELQDLLKAIRADTPTRTPMREGARSLDFALAAARSNEIHAPVDL